MIKRFDSEMIFFRLDWEEVISYRQKRIFIVKRIHNRFCKVSTASNMCKWNACLHNTFPGSGSFSLTSYVNSYNFLWKIGKHFLLLALPAYLHSWKQFFSSIIFKLSLNLQSCASSIWTASSDSEIFETTVEYIAEECQHVSRIC